MMTLPTEPVRISAEAMQIEPVIVVPVVAAPLPILLMAWPILTDRRRMHN